MDEIEYNWMVTISQAVYAVKFCEQNSVDRNSIQQALNVQKMDIFQVKIKFGLKFLG